MIELTYKYTCDVQGCCSWAEGEMVKIAVYGARPPYPSKPQGWRLLEGLLYCPLHDVTITVEDKVSA